MAGAIASVVLSLLFWFPAAAGGSAMLNAVPFMDRMAWVFIASLALTVIVSLAQPAPTNRIAILDGVEFRASPAFILSAAVVVASLVAIYAVWW